MIAQRAKRTSLVALLAVACAGAFAPPATAAAQSGPDVLRIPLPRYDGTLTPYTFELGYPAVTLIYDTLLWRDAKGVPQPWLARSITRRRGGRRLVIELRPGLFWHDGRPVTAADVAFTFRYVASHFQPRFTPQLVDVERVRATGPRTATIDLRRPSLGFDDQPLADLPILPRHLWQGVRRGRTPAGLPVGSGPYRVVSERRGEGYVLRANRSYFRGAPRVPELRLPIVGDADQTYRALTRRRVDMVPLNASRTTAKALDGTLGIDLRSGASYSGTTLLLNVRRPPFDRVEVRQAVAAALDLPRIARDVAPARAADGGFVHPDSRWAADAPVHRFDLPAARRVLAGPGLAALRILAPKTDPVRLEIGRQVVLSLRRAGAKATLVQVPGSELGRAVGEDGTPPRFDAAIQSIPALVSDDPDYLRTLFGADPKSAPLNFSGYSSAAFDRLARQVASVPAPGARRRAVQAELELLARDAPSIPLLFPEGAQGYRSALYDGWVFVKGTGIFDKRSFLPGEAPTSRRPSVPAPAAGTAAEADSGSGFGVVDALSILALAAVAFAAAFALLQRRST